MSILLETTIGDLVIDLDVDGSPALCKNILKLTKARYFTQNLVYNIHPNRFFQLGDPRGDGKGGACIYGVLDAYETARNTGTEPDVFRSKRRFLRSDMGRGLTREECRQKGRVVATEISGIADTIGSQLLFTVAEGVDNSLDGFGNYKTNNTTGNNESITIDQSTSQIFRSVGTVVEDDNDVLSQINSAYCDAACRPYADLRVIRALIVDDPFDDPTGLDRLLEDRGVTLVKVNSEHTDDDTESVCSWKVTASPDYERPPEEVVEKRISADQIDHNTNDDVEDQQKLKRQEEERLKRDDKSRAVVLEMLGDLPSANITAPENVLFVCKLNPVTEDDDLELIFSRFDQKVSADIVRDHKTGASLQYAFIEFTTKDQAAEAYFKMNNALVDDRRIKVDFSQSVSKVWDRFNQRNRQQSSSNHSMPKNPFREQQQQQQISHKTNSRRDRKRDTFPRKDYERYRDTNHNKKGDGRSMDREMSDSHRNDHYSRPSGDYKTYRDRDRYARDRYSRDRDRDRYTRDHHNSNISHERRRTEGTNRDNSHMRSRSIGDNSDKYSRSKDHPSHRTDRRRDKSVSTHLRERTQGYDSGTSSSEGSRSKRRKRSDEDRRRCSRSSSDSSSGSCTKRRERHRRSHKKSKKKRGRKRDDGKHHSKRSKRDNTHRHHRCDSS